MEVEVIKERENNILYALNSGECNLARMEIEVITKAFKKYYRYGMGAVLEKLAIHESTLSQKMNHYGMDIIQLKKDCVSQELSIAEMERNTVIEAFIKLHDKTYDEVAATLGMSDRWLYRKVNEFGLNVEELRKQGARASMYLNCYN